MKTSIRFNTFLWKEGPLCLALSRGYLLPRYSISFTRGSQHADFKIQT
jgi:hypothetical protein